MEEETDLASESLAGGSGVELVLRKIHAHMPPNGDTQGQRAQAIPSLRTLYTWRGSEHVLHEHVSKRLGPGRTMDRIMMQ